jgi:hypothetical protein
MVNSKVEDLIAKLKNVTPQKAEAGLLEIIRKHASQLIDLNTNQLMHGENAEGGVLGIYRSESYKKLKSFLNPDAGGKVDVKLTGDFQRSFFLEAEKFPIGVFATDLKTGKLSEMYDHIFGFSAKSKTIAVEDIKPEAVELIQGMLQI